MLIWRAILMIEIFLFAAAETKIRIYLKNNKFNANYPWINLRRKKYKFKCNLLKKKVEKAKRLSMTSFFIIACVYVEQTKNQHHNSHMLVKRFQHLKERWEILF